MDVLAWLLDPREPSMRYLASRDLLGPRPSDAAIARLRSDVPTRGWAKAILDRQRAGTYWGRPTNGYLPYYSASIWHLQVLADLGMTRKDLRIRRSVEWWLGLHTAGDGGFTPRAGGHHRGHLCTTGNMVRSLIRFGYLDDRRVQAAIRWLVTHQYADGGWDCYWRGKGNLDSWEGMSAFGEIPPSRRSPDVKAAIRSGAEFYLRHRLLHEGRRYAPWYWLRYPWHFWYDALVGLDFMTALGYAADPRLDEALRHLESRRRPDGRWNLSSNNGYAHLGPRGKPSKMITFLALRVQKRVREARGR
jgi:hypothetical protein